jgi:hypothetical protein
MKPDFGISGLNALLIPVFIYSIDDMTNDSLQEKYGKIWEKLGNSSIRGAHPPN